MNASPRAVAGLLGLAACLSGCGGDGEDAPDGEDAGAPAAELSARTLLFAPPAGESAQNAAFSPDGARLLFTVFHRGYNEGPAGLFLAPLPPRGPAGTPEALLDEEDADNVNLPGPSWSAAAGLIVFASDRVDVGEIWTASPEGGAPQRVTTHPPGSGDYQEPSFSPTGAWIVFEQILGAGAGARGRILKVRADGSELTTLVDDPALDARQPSWSPAGGLLLFQGRAVGAEGWRVFTMDAGGAGRAQLTHGGTTNTDASFSPDGRFVVYSSDEGGAALAELFAVPVAGGDPLRVTRNPTGYDGAPSWSPDGRRIAFESSAGDEQPTALYVVPAPQGARPTADLEWPPDPDAPPVAGGDWYRPPAGVAWQWQLAGDLNLSYEVPLYDVDLFEAPDAALEALHAANRRALCYFSAGSAEDWRPDLAGLAAEDLGEPLDGWPGERWLDIRSRAVMALMLNRMDRAVARGCDGVEPDNVDGFDNRTGFPLTERDQLAYNRALANAAHRRGLAVALKNDGAQSAELVDYYDLALNEQCHDDDECGDLAVFIARGKPALNAEYAPSRQAAEARARTLCSAANRAGLSTLVLPLALDDSFRVSCLPDR